MTLNEYQGLAGRTINTGLTLQEVERHALYGLCGEVGEIHSLYQKRFQGHDFMASDLSKEIGDVCWMIAELCTAHGWSLDEICAENIEKLRKRYPDGFDAERSLYREEKE